MKANLSKEEYFKLLATRLRQIEAERARGDMAKLEDLEQTTDATLLRKWTLVSAIVGAAGSFFLMPLLISVVQPFIPEWADTLLWSIAKVSMGLALLMFGAAIYFTLGMNQD
ncbi:MAG: hypothetical protein K2X27_04460 [Candidatus Obscuribacterales bacterium]|nr:hypothetical protein [Candidatus Obscuribacterales bacterium]